MCQQSKIHVHVVVRTITTHVESALHLEVEAKQYLWRRERPAVRRSCVHRYRRTPGYMTG